MKTRSWCVFCERQLDDREDIVRNNVTGALAHVACVAARPTEHMCDGPCCVRCKAPLVAMRDPAFQVEEWP